MNHPTSEHITDWLQINGKGYWCDLSHYQWLNISGPDATTFLNGQATIKTIDQSDNTLQFGAFCNLKGRVTASFWAFQFAPEHIQLLMAAEMADAMAQHLQKYAQFSKVNLSVKPATGLSGCSVNVWTIDTPAVNQCINQDQQSWLARLYPPAPFFIAHNLPAPSNPITQIAPESWDALLSANGLILVGIEQTEQWLPQQLNYDLFDAINFEKGCYTGQEVVARLHYRGKTKDRIMSGTIKDVTDHSHLAKVAVESGKTVGRILTSLPLPSGQTLITGVFKTDALHELSRGSSVGSINWIEPKYAIPYE